MSEALVQYVQVRILPGATCVACGAAGPLERDHCHEHGWVRGIVCRPCNRHLHLIDRRLLQPVKEDLLAAQLSVRNRCPDCDPLDIADLASPRPRKPKPKPGPGPGYRAIRFEDDLWDRLGKAARRADPDTNRSVLVRKLARWFVGDIDELPQRPEPKREGR
jgi:hypothetical protein